MLGYLVFRGEVSYYRVHGVQGLGLGGLGFRDQGLGLRVFGA